MTDPFDLRTREQRVVVGLAVVAYFALFAIELTTGDPRALALSDLVVAALAVPAGAVVVRRATALAETDRIAAVAGAAFLVAGLAHAYRGLVVFADLESIAVIEYVGSASLLLALVLYLYHSWE